MAKKNQQQKAYEIHQLYDRLNTRSRERWEEVNQEAHDYYLDNQLSAEERKALEEQGMPTFTINRIIPIVEMLVFYATANDPRWQAVGAEGSDTDVAAVHADIADYIWYNSNGKQLMSQVVTDAATKSMGFFQVYIDPNDDRGMGEVKVRSLEPFDVYIDPQSKDSLFRDAAYMLLHKIIPRNTLMNQFPEYKAKIKSATGNTTTPTSYSKKSDWKDFQAKDITEAIGIFGEDEDLLEYYEKYEKIKVEYRNVYYRIEPTQKQIDDISTYVEAQMLGFKEELQVQMTEKEMQLQQQLESGQIIRERFALERAKLQLNSTQQLEQMKTQKTQELMEEVSRIENEVVTEKEFQILMKGELKNNLVEAIKFYETKIRLTVAVGDQLLFESILPGTDYPIIPVHYKHTGTPFPLSAVSPLIGKQKELNKAHQLMVHNASLGSSLRWMYVDGSVDVDYWEKYASAPGALLPVNNGYEPPREVQPAQLSSAFANIVAQGKQDMEYLAGIYSSMQGDMKAQHDTYKGLLANDEYGTRRVKAWIDGNVKASLTQLGLLVRDYSQFLYKAQKVFRIVQPSAIQEERSVSINVPMFNNLGEAIGKFNDYSAARFDVRVIAGNSLPINRWAYLGELKELMQLGVIDDMAVLAETDVKNKEQIAERKSMLAQLQGQIAQMEEQAKDSAGTIETLERQLVQAGIKDKVRQVEHDMRKKLVDTSAKLKGDAAVNKAQLDMHNKEMQLIEREEKKNFDKRAQGEMNGAQQIQQSLEGQPNEGSSDNIVGNEKN
jgi:hypothetical protein